MRTNIEIDDDLLEAAQRELGTANKKDTVNGALAYTASRGARAARLVNNAFDFYGEDITDPEIMKQARR